jgi:hypothetical protein
MGQVGPPILVLRLGSGFYFSRLFGACNIYNVCTFVGLGVNKRTEYVGLRVLISKRHQPYIDRSTFIFAVVDIFLKIEG